jgi:DNA-binding NarL/FixJ family response regulator
MTAGAVPVRVVIADDTLHFRRGLRSVLEESDTGIEVVGEAADGLEAAAQIRTHQPDVALLDLNMPGLDGIAVAEQVARECPGTRVLMLTISDRPEDVALATRAGVAGYVLKERSVEEVIDAVLAVAAGRPWPLAAG